VILYDVDWNANWVDDILGVTRRHLRTKWPSNRCRRIAFLSWSWSCDGLLRRKARTSESLAVKIVEITYRTNGLAIRHARELNQSSKRLVVQKALRMSSSHSEDLRHISAKTVVERAVAKTVPG
jgi:hypothetical protein